MTAAASPRRWLSVDEAAELLGVTRDTVYSWIRHRGLPAKKVGRLWKLDAGRVSAWQDEVGEPPDTSAARTPSNARSTQQQPEQVASEPLSAAPSLRPRPRRKSPPPQTQPWRELAPNPAHRSRHIVCTIVAGASGEVVAASPIPFGYRPAEVLRRRGVAWLPQPHGARVDRALDEVLSRGIRTRVQLDVRGPFSGYRFDIEPLHSNAELIGALIRVSLPLELPAEPEPVAEIRTLGECWETLDGVVEAALREDPNCAELRLKFAPAELRALARGLRAALEDALLGCDWGEMTSFLQLHMGTFLERSIGVTALFGLKTTIDAATRQAIQKLEIAAQLTTALERVTTHTLALACAVYCEQQKVLEANHLAMALRASHKAAQACRSWTSITSSRHDAILTETLDGIITQWNEGCEVLYGYQAAEAIGRTADELLVPRDRAGEMLERYERVRRQVAVGPFRTQRCTKAGERIDIELRLSPILDEAGVVVGISALARDLRRELPTDVESTDPNRTPKVET